MEAKVFFSGFSQCCSTSESLSRMPHTEKGPICFQQSVPRLSNECSTAGPLLFFVIYHLQLVTRPTLREAFHWPSDLLKTILAAKVKTDKKMLWRPSKKRNRTKLNDWSCCVGRFRETSTNVPLSESIGYTVDLFYSARHSDVGFRRCTPELILENTEEDVIMPPHRRYYKHVAGTALRSSDLNYSQL